jgi:hypothetical protein
MNGSFFYVKAAEEFKKKQQEKALPLAEEEPVAKKLKVTHLSSLVR